MNEYLLAGLALASWLGNAAYCGVIVRRAFRLPVADEGALVARYNRWGRKTYDFNQLLTQLPHLEVMVPGLRYTALVPLAISVTFGINALVRFVWIQDGTTGVWTSIALIALPIALTVYLLAWEQQLLLARLAELSQGARGSSVKELREKLAASDATDDRKGA